MNRLDKILKQLNELEEQLKLGEIFTTEESATHLKICSKLMYLRDLDIIKDNSRQVDIVDKWGITQPNISAIKRGKITKRIYS